MNTKFNIGIKNKRYFWGTEQNQIYKNTHKKPFYSSIRATLQGKTLYDYRRITPTFRRINTIA